MIALSPLDFSQDLSQLFQSKTDNRIESLNLTDFSHSHV